MRTEPKRDVQSIADIVHPYCSPSPVDRLVSGIVISLGIGLGV